MGAGIFKKGHPDFAIEASGVLPFLFRGGGFAALPERALVRRVGCVLSRRHNFGFMLNVGTGSYA
jgi:hypothetical protein